MKKTYLLIGSIIAMLVISMISVAIFYKSNNDNKISIVTTLFPLYDFAKEIGGDKVNVTLLLPPGAEAHSYEPTPSDINKINEADIFIYTGEIMEPWAHDIIEGLTGDVLVINASDNVELLTANKDEAHDEEDAIENSEADHSNEAHAIELCEQLLDKEVEFSLKAGDAKTSAQRIAESEEDHSENEGIEETEHEEEHSHQREIFSVELPVKDPNSKYAGYLSFVSESEEGYAFSISEGNIAVFDAQGQMLTPKQELTIDCNDMKVGEVYILPVGEYVIEISDSLIEKIEMSAAPMHGEEDHGHTHDHNHGGVDPHFWLDFSNAKIIAEEITAGISQIDSQNKDFYSQNLKAYTTKLTELDENYQVKIATCESKTIYYGGHYAFGYLANRYGLSYVAAQGFSPDAEPSAKEMIDLVDSIRQNNISTIFYEELVSPKIAETLANETNTKLLLLNGAHNISKEDYENNVTFISIMENNLENLSLGLKCN